MANEHYKYIHSTLGHLYEHGLKVLVNVFVKKARHLRKGDIYNMIQNNEVDQENPEDWGLIDWFDETEEIDTEDITPIQMEQIKEFMEEMENFGVDNMTMIEDYFEKLQTFEYPENEMTKSLSDVLSQLANSELNLFEQDTNTVQNPELNNIKEYDENNDCFFKGDTVTFNGAAFKMLQDRRHPADTVDHVVSMNKDIIKTFTIYTEENAKILNAIHFNNTKDCFSSLTLPLRQDEFRYFYSLETMKIYELREPGNRIKVTPVKFTDLFDNEYVELMEGMNKDNSFNIVGNSHVKVFDLKVIPIGLGSIIIQMRIHQIHCYFVMLENVLHLQC